LTVNGLPKDRVLSTVDPQARHTRKTSARKRDGYKAHVAAEPGRHEEFDPDLGCCEVGGAG
jgi:hypothetical protein